jgi:hypothetical protein
MTRSLGLGWVTPYPSAEWLWPGALVLLTKGDDKFDESVRGGDSSFRVVPKDIRVGDLADSHRSESLDHSAMEAAPNLAFPLSRIQELADEGFIGEVAPRHISNIGSITAPGSPVRASGLRQDLL